MTVDQQMILIFLLGFFIGRYVKMFILAFAVKMFFSIMPKEEKEKTKKSFQERLDEMMHKNNG